MKNFLGKLIVCVFCLIFVSCDVSQGNLNGFQTTKNNQNVLLPTNKSNQQSVTNNKSNQLPSTAPIPNDGLITTNYQDEAITEYKKVLDGKFTQCGDSYYTEVIGKYWLTSGQKAIVQNDYDSVNGIFRFKDVKFSPYEKPLTEAEKLNGVEWSGGVAARFKAVRVHQKDEGWSEWGDGVVIDVISTRSLDLMLTAEKKNSVWHIEKGQIPYSRLKKVNCSDISN